MQQAIAISNWNLQLQKLSGVLLVLAGFLLPLSISFTEITLLLAVIAGLSAGQWREKFNVIRRQPVALFFLIMYAVLLIGISYSTANWHAASSVLMKYNKLLIASLLFPIWAMIGTVWRRRGIHAFLLGTLLVLLLSYLSFFNLLPSSWIDDPSTIFKNHIDQNFLIAFACYFLGLKAREAMTLRYRVLFAVLAVLAGFNALFLSTGRSGYIVLLALLVLFLWQLYRWRGLFYAALGCAVLIGAVLFTSSISHQRLNLMLHNYHQYKMGQADTSIGQRITFAANGWKLFKRHPWFGTGTGSFAKEYLSLNPEKAVITDNPHNEYLNLGVQLGVVGVILLLVLWVLIWRESLSLPVTHKWMAQSIVVGFALGCFINSWLMDSTEGYFLIYFVSLALSKKGGNEMDDLR